MDTGKYMINDAIKENWKNDYDFKINISLNIWSSLFSSYFIG